MNVLAHTSSYLSPAVLAAATTAVALILREVVGRVFQSRQSRRDLVLQQSELTLSQVKMLWDENARLKADGLLAQKSDRELREQIALLTARCRDLEAIVTDLRSRLERPGRLAALANPSRK